VIVKVADVEPAGIVTLAGTTALGEFDEIVKAAPPGPAWPLSKTVPVADIPPRTEEGEMVNPLIEADELGCPSPGDTEADPQRKAHWPKTGSRLIAHHGFDSLPRPGRDEGICRWCFRP